MNLINRSALVLRAKEPYVQWAMHVDASSYRHEAALRKDVFVFLVPPDPTGRFEAAPLEWYFEEAFESILAGWYRDESAWPPVRDLATFKAWFEIDTRSMVFDLDDEELELEEYEP